MRRATFTIAQILIVGFALLGAGSVLAWGQTSSGGESTSADESGSSDWPDDGSLTSSVADPCTLITASEAAELFGVPVSTVPGVPQCTHVAEDESTRALSVGAPRLPDVPQDVLGAGMAEAASGFGGEQRTLNDVGDEAHALLTPLLTHGLARLGDDYVTVVLIAVDGTDDERVSLVADLLRTALSRL